MYQIHEVCERCHLSRKAIRLYEEKGLLHPDRIQGNRMYNKEDVVRLQCISYYRGLGFSLEQIQQLLHGSSEKCLKELLMTHKKQLNQKLEEKQEQLAQAIRDGKITFFVAKRGYRAVGMCSISRCFSTFACTDVGIFDDFYIEPAFRKKGAAWLLAQAAQEWSKENALASLTVTCAPCDEGMYQALGFDTHLGNTFAYLR